MKRFWTFVEKNYYKIVFWFIMVTVLCAFILVAYSVVNAEVEDECGSLEGSCAYFDCRADITSAPRDKGAWSTRAISCKLSEKEKG